MLFLLFYFLLFINRHTKCKQKIEKGSVRIGKVSPSPFSEGSELTQWFHLKCSFDQMKNPRATKLESLEELEGLDELEGDHAAEVHKLYDALKGM